MNNNKEALANCIEKLKAFRQEQSKKLEQAILSPSTTFVKVPNSIDWEQCRYEIAKELMAGFIANSHNQIIDANFKTLAKWSVECADELIKQLKEDVE